MRPRPGTDAAKDFIYVGRMVASKRPDLLLEGFLHALPSLSPAVRLLMVGDGPLVAALQRQVIEIKETHRVQFFGHVSDVGELRSLYSLALAAVSPGYVGLSIIQSLAFGVPMIVADDEPHAPEIEAARSGLNCVYFTARSVQSLSHTLVDVHRNADTWRDRSAIIAESCRNTYSVETLAERLLEACYPPRNHRAAPYAATDNQPI
jgi:glycosyltransferase involved in cell wall biosynthesis